MAIFGNFRVKFEENTQILSFGQIWSDSVGLGRIRSDLVGFGRTWSDSVGLGRSSPWEGTFLTGTEEELWVAFYIKKKHFVPPSPP